MLIVKQRMMDYDGLNNTRKIEKFKASCLDFQGSSKHLETKAKSSNQ